MKGRDRFRPSEAERIKRLLAAREHAGALRRRLIDHQLRGLGFDLRDWPEVRSAADLDRLVRERRINIVAEESAEERGKRGQGRKDCYTRAEAEEIRRLVASKERAARRESKRIRRRLRGAGFYLSEWPEVETAEDFGRLIDQGHIRICNGGDEPPSATGPQTPRPPTAPR